MRKSFYVTSDRTTHFVQLHLYFYFRFRPGSVGNQIHVIDRDLRFFFLSDTPLESGHPMQYANRKGSDLSLSGFNAGYAELNTRLSPSIVCDAVSRKKATRFMEILPGFASREAGE